VNPGLALPVKIEDLAEGCGEYLRIEGPCYYVFARFA
jgi:hypothetical protein